MNPRTILLPGIILMLLAGCNGRHATTRNFSVTIDSKKKDIRLYSTIKIGIKNKKNFNIDSVAVTIAGRRMPVVKDSITLKGIKPGKQELSTTIFYNETSETLKKTITIFSHIKPKIYTYTIINEYPHDRDAYTQGLEFYNDTLYESTGQRGRSSLRKTDYKTGQVLARLTLSDDYFGEGITILNDTLYLLTWQSGKGFVYDPKTFKPLGSFAYGKSKEGWGLCNDGTKLYKSDGTEKIWTLNPKTLVEEDYIQTVTNASISSKANELEFVNGKIYANTFLKDGVMIINPENGIIEGVVDFRGLKNKVTQHEKLDVLNGIAYNPKTQTFFITGKNWDKLFEVEILEKKK